MGGGQRLLLDVVEHFAAAGHDLHTAFPEVGPVTESLEANGLPVHQFKLAKLEAGKKGVRQQVRFFANCIPTRNDIRRLILATQPDLIYINGPRVVLPAILAARKLNVPVVAAVHLLFEGKERQLLQWCFEQAIVKRVIYCSDLAARPFASLGAKGITIENWVNRRFLEPLSPSPKDELMVGLLGRISKNKGQRLLLEAMLPILQKDQAVSLWFGGSSDFEDGCEETLLRDEAREATGADRIHFVGAVEDAPAFLDSTDIIVVPSEKESFGLVAAEAGARGKAVVCTKAGAMPQIVENGKTGLVVEREASSIREAIQSLIDNPDTRHQMGSAARQRIEKDYASAPQLAKVLAVCKEAATPRPTAAELPNPSNNEPELEAMSRREVAVGYAWNLFFGMLTKLAFPILQLVFYRLLGPFQIGIYAVLIPIFQIAETMRDAGLAVTFIADREATGKREGGYASLAIISAAVFALFIFVARIPMAHYFNMPQLDWGLSMVALAVFLNGFCTVPVNKLQRKARFRDAGFADFAATLLSFVVATVLVLRGFGFVALVWQFFSKGIIYGAICWSLEPSKIEKPDPTVIREIWRHSHSNLLNNLLYTVYTVADTLMINKLFGVTAGGNYQAAYTYGSKPLEFFTFPLARTLLVAYSRKNHDHRALAGIFTRTISVSILAMLPVYVLVGVFAKPLVILLLSSKYIDAVPLLMLLAIYCGARSVGSLSGNVLVAMKKQIYNVAGWIAAYMTVGVVLWTTWAHRSTFTAVAALTAGTVVVYAVNLVSALLILKPNRESLDRLQKSLGLALLAAGAIFVVAYLPIKEWMSLTIAAAVLPPLYLLGIGMVLAGSPTACFSKRGIKRLWEEV